MKTRYVVGVVAVMVLLLTLGARFSTADDPGIEVSSVPHYQDTMVQVRITDEAEVSRGQQPYLVQRESGTIPDDVAQLTVLTDENCQPDAEGVSHCLNRVRFTTANGDGEASLRHHHRMAEEPCLTPGQIVELVA